MRDVDYKIEEFEKCMSLGRNEISPDSTRYSELEDERKMIEERFLSTLDEKQKKLYNRLVKINDSMNTISDRMSRRIGEVTGMCKMIEVASFKKSDT